MDALLETATFMVHAIKQFAFGFETMNATADEYEDGSAAQAFFLTALYHYLVAFYLLDKNDRPMGGSFHRALAPHGLTHLLEPVQELMNTPLGGSTFGEVLRVFRNKVIVHSSYRDADLDRLYAKVDMSSPQVYSVFQDLIFKTYLATRQLAVDVVKATGASLEDFGIHVNQEAADDE